MPLTPTQIQTVKATVPVLQKHGEAITRLFYATMLAENPELKPIFNHANQFNNHQPAALAGALYAYAMYIDDLGVLSPAVEKICQKHASLYIQPEQYDVVGKYLLQAMGEVLGDALTPAILEAWRVAYSQLAEIMISRESTLYHTHPTWPTWRPLRVSRRVRESSTITSFYLTPLSTSETLPPFLPGRYISLLLDVPALGHAQARQYSLSDAPGKGYYRVSVKREDGGDSNDPGSVGKEGDAGLVSNLLHQTVKEGDVLRVSHPAGEFFLDPDAETKNASTSDAGAGNGDEDGNAAPVVLISAGVGITPTISILNTLVERGSQRQVTFIHGTRSSKVQAFGKHVQELADAYSNITKVVFNKNPAEDAVEGVDYDFATRVDLEKLDRRTQLFLDRGDTEYFVCGPAGFMKDVLRKLREWGVEDGRVHAEFFGTGGIPSAD